MNPFVRESVSSLAPDGKFKSTEIWDEIVYAFCLGMPVQKHRKFLKSFNDTFQAKEAVNWIHDYLMLSPHFMRHKVSRFQAVKLLRKFVQFDIITRADRKNGDEYEFHDNQDLYTFTKCVSEKMPLEPRPPPGANQILSPSTSCCTISSRRQPLKCLDNSLTTAKLRKVAEDGFWL